MCDRLQSSAVPTASKPIYKESVIVYVTVCLLCQSLSASKMQSLSHDYSLDRQSLHISMLIEQSKVHCKLHGSTGGIGHLCCDNRYNDSIQAQPNQCNAGCEQASRHCLFSSHSLNRRVGCFAWGRSIACCNGLCNAGVLMTPRSLPVHRHGTHRINTAGNACSERQDLRDKNMLMKYKAYSEQEHLNSGMTEGYKMWTNHLPSC